MKRLLAFYQSGLTTIDWNRYNQIDLRFEHQIVARNTEVKALVDKTLEKEKEKEKELKQLGIANATQKTKR
jgi:hypothetical protein